jgi:hypothetical protein
VVSHHGTPKTGPVPVQVVVFNNGALRSAAMTAPALLMRRA